MTPGERRQVMEPVIRACRPSDRDAVVALALRAWAPVFASMRDVLGRDLDDHLHGPDWRDGQRAAVDATLGDDGMHVWVAEIEAAVVGFVAVTLDREQSIGQVWMVAVDPAAQRQGVGSLLTAWATDRIRDAGMRVAMIGTGGDPGHAPARRVYERAGYTPMPLVQYYKVL